MDIIRKILRLISPPGLRYHIFSGENTWTEWFRALSQWASPDNDRSESLVTLYETKFAAAVGTRFAFGFASGRMCLYAILEALGIGPGDEVIIPAFTCVVVPNAILYRGAKPVYVDISAKTFNIDVSRIESAITPRTKALYAQHTFGLICDVEALKALAQKHRLPVIEDAAHALGAKFAGRPAGSLTEVAFFSTDHSKVINTGVGGMITTSDPALAAKLDRIRSTTPWLPSALVRKMMQTFLIEFILFRPLIYWIGNLIHSVLLKKRVLFYFQDELKTQKPDEYPYPARLSSFQAKLGSSQLDRLQENLAGRRKIGLALEERFKWNAGLLEGDCSNHIFLRYSFLVHDRASFEAALHKHFDLGIWFTSVAAGRSTNFEAIGYRVGSCPVAEHIARHIVNLPTHATIPYSTLLAEVAGVTTIEHPSDVPPALQTS